MILYYLLSCYWNRCFPGWNDLMRIFLKTIFNSAEATQVNISAASGDMGILANHVPSVEPLRPGVLEVIESNGQSQKWFGKLSIIRPHTRTRCELLSYTG